MNKRMVLGLILLIFGGMVAIPLIVAGFLIAACGLLAVALGLVFILPAAYTFPEQEVMVGNYTVIRKESAIHVHQGNSEISESDFDDTDDATDSGGNSQQ